jgi:WD40 repeat protein
MVSAVPGGQVVNQHELTIQNHPGREVVVSAQGGQKTLIVRMVLVRERFFVYMVEGQSYTASSPDVVKFLDSFQLDADQGKPVKPVEPIKPIDPVKPVKPVEPVKPPEPVTPKLPSGLKRIQFGGKGVGRIQSLVVSADGSTILADGWDRKARAFAADTLAVRSEMPLSNNPGPVALSPDGATQAVVVGQTLQLSTTKGGFLGSVNLPDLVWCLAFSPDGKTLAAGTSRAGGEIKIWEVAGAREQASWQKNVGQVHDLAFSPDGLTVATAGRPGGTVRLWEAATGREYARLKGHTGDEVRSVAFAADGKTLASGGSDNTIRIWDAQRGRERFRVEGHTGAVIRVAFAPDGKTLASAGMDRTVRLWDTASGKLLHTLNPTGNVTGLGFARGDALVIGVDNGTIDRWDLKEIPDLTKRPGPIQPDLDRAPAPSIPDLAPIGQVTPFTAAVVDPEGAILVFTRDRFLRRHAGANLAVKGNYWLGALAYHAVLDAPRGLVYVAVSEPRTLTQTPAGSWHGWGDLHIYDVKDILKGKESGGILRPVAVLPLNTPIADLILSSDGAALYYLDVRDPSKSVVGKIDTAGRKKVAELVLDQPAVALRAGPGGKTLYAAGVQTLPGGKREGVLQWIDPGELKVTRTLPLDLVPIDLQVGEGVAFVLGEGANPLGVVDLKPEPPALVARWPGVVTQGRIRLAGGGKRLYLANRVTPMQLSAFDVPEKIDPKAPNASDQVAESNTLPLRGDLLLSPDGKYLLTNAGAVFRVDGVMQRPAPAGVGEKKEEKEPVGKGVGRVKERPAFTNGHSYRVLALAYSPNGMTLLTAEEDRRLVQCEVAMGTAPRWLTTNGGMHAVCFSPLGRWAASSWGGTIYSGTTTSRANLLARGTVAAGIESIGISPDGKQAAWSGDRTLTIGPLGRVAELHSIPAPASLTGVAWAATGLLAAGGEDGQVYLFEPAGEKEKLTLKGHTGEVRCVAFSPDGKYLASGGLDREVRVWNPAESKELHVLKGHTHLVLCLAFAGDGKTLASGGADGVVRLWDAEAGKELAVLPTTAGALVTGLAFSPDGQTLAAAVERQVRRWDVSELVKGKVDVPKPPVVAEVPRPDDTPGIEAKETARVLPHHAAVIDANGKFALYGDNGAVMRYSYPEFRGATRLNVALPLRFVLPLALDDAAGKLYALGGMLLHHPSAGRSSIDNPSLMVFSLSEWRVEKLRDMPKPVATLPLTGSFAQLVLSPDGKALYTLDLRNKKVLRIDPAGSKVEQEKEVEEPPVALSLTPDGKTLYVVASTGSRRLGVPRVPKGANVNKLLALDPASLEVKASHALARVPVDVAATNAGLVAVVTQELGQSELQVLDAAKGFAVRTSQAGYPSWYRIAWAPDQKRLYCVTRMGNRTDIRPWDVPAEANAPLKAGPASWFGGFNQGNGFVISPDGKFLVMQNGSMVELAAAAAEKKP